MTTRSSLPRPWSSRRSRARRVAGAAVAAGLLLLTACGGNTGSADARGSRGDADGFLRVQAPDRQRAPALSGPTVDGQPLDAAAYRGKIVVLNVWESTCAPCRAEAPAFAKVAGRTRQQGVVFLGINTRETSRAAARSFEKAHKITYPSLYDPDGRVLLGFPRGTFPQTIPVTVVLDRRGRIAARAFAPLGERSLRALIRPVVSED
ncbi:TlpA disulfide reductase family protein [Streptomyces sp. NPDC049954]|uniref:TlpA family protein disulfide reductase n=1 Tax=Streptomyces sp. NPDC049954 TaxID=3155779 RepID=UPI00343739ED